MKKNFTIPFIFLLFSAFRAHAQGRDPAAAEALFKEGRKAADAGDYETACVRFRESERLDAAVGTEFNLADCEEHRGKLAEAWQLFRRTLEQLTPTDERWSIAKDREQSLAGRVPKLIVR